MPSVHIFTKADCTCFRSSCYTASSCRHSASIAYAACCRSTGSNILRSQHIFNINYISIICICRYASSSCRYLIAIADIANAIRNLRCYAAACTYFAIVTYIARTNACNNIRSSLHSICKINITLRYSIFYFTCKRIHCALIAYAASIRACFNTLTSINLSSKNNTAFIRYCGYTTCLRLNCPDISNICVRRQSNVLSRAERATAGNAAAACNDNISASRYRLVNGLRTSVISIYHISLSHSYIACIIGQSDCSNSLQRRQNINSADNTLLLIIQNRNVTIIDAFDNNVKVVSAVVNKMNFTCACIPQINMLQLIVCTTQSNFIISCTVKVLCNDTVRVLLQYIAANDRVFGFGQVQVSRSQRTLIKLYVFASFYNNAAFALHYIARNNNIAACI